MCARSASVIIFLAWAAAPLPAYSHESTHVLLAQSDDDGDEVVVPRRPGSGRPSQNPDLPGGIQPGPGFRPPPPPQNLGNVCFTPAGPFVGPWNPLGAPCNATLPNGQIVLGQVGRFNGPPPILPMPR